MTGRPRRLLGLAWLAPNRHIAIRADVRRELEHHLAESTEHLLRLGYSPAEAHAEAVRRLGALDDAAAALTPAALSRERHMQIRLLTDAARQDLRYTARRLAGQPLSTFIVVLTLALGTSASATIFPLIDRLVLREPSGVRDPKEVRRIYMVPKDLTHARAAVSYPEFLDIADGLGRDAKTAAFIPAAASIAGDTATQHRVGLNYVTDSYFAVLGIRLERGRFFTREEASPRSSALVAVISHELWISRFESSPDILSRTVRIGGRQFTVVGVTAPGFEGTDLEPSRVWLPVGLQRTVTSRNQWWTSRDASALSVLARVQRGVDERGLEQRLTRRMALAAAASGNTRLIENAHLGSLLQARGPGQQPEERLIATRLSAVSLILLLIAVGNVTNLLVARSIGRQREIAMRQALGISRSRLILLFLLEAACLAAMAALAGAAVGAIGSRVLRSLLLPALRWEPALVDLRSVAFSATLAALITVLTGLIPAAHSLRGALADELKTGGTGDLGRGDRVRGALVLSQAALAALLLTSAGLFIKSLDHVRHVDPGFRLAGLVALTASPNPSLPGALEEARVRVAAMPGVGGAALAKSAPLYGLSQRRTFLGGADSAVSDALTPDLNGVSPEFFSTTGLSLVRGRAFSGDDRAGASPVAVVNEAAAQAFWPGQDAIGQCVKLDSVGSPCRHVIGIVRNARRSRVVEDPVLQAYVPLAQFPGAPGPEVLLIRAKDDPGSAAQIAKQDIATRLGAGTSVSVISYQNWLEPQLAPWRLGARLFGTVAFLALVLTALGMYGLLTYTVTQQTRQIGLRIALGASVHDIVGSVVARAMRMVAVGILAGLALAFVGGRLIEGSLFGTSPHDPGVYMGVALVLIVSSLAAALVPAIRAAHILPTIALRAD